MASNEINVYSKKEFRRWLKGRDKLRFLSISLGASSHYYRWDAEKFVFICGDETKNISYEDYFGVLVSGDVVGIYTTEDRLNKDKNNPSFSHASHVLQMVKPIEDMSILWLPYGPDD